jgi:hypothetical protein
VTDTIMPKQIDAASIYQSLLRIFFFFLGKFSFCSSGWPVIHYAAQAGLKLVIFLLLPF